MVKVSLPKNWAGDVLLEIDETEGIPYNIQKVGCFDTFGVQDCPVVQFDVKHAEEMTLPQWKTRTKRKLSALGGSTVTLLSMKPTNRNRDH